MAWVSTSEENIIDKKVYNAHVTAFIAKFKMVW